MKKFLYSLYAVMFTVFRIFPLNNRKVTFLSPHNEHFSDSLGAVMEAVIRRDENEVVTVSTQSLKIDRSSAAAFFASVCRAVRFFTSDVFHLATSKYVFLNDNFMPLAGLKFRKETVITQLWHAEGVFKKFGFDIEQPEEIRSLEKGISEKLTYVVCSSEHVAPIYARAFGVPEEKVLPLGAPRADLLLSDAGMTNIRERFDRAYPRCKGKKLVLYAPTFRSGEEDDRALLSHFDTKLFNERFGSEYELLVKLHPQVSRSERTEGEYTDVTDYNSVSLLIRLCDVLITDYSSICMDFALLDKNVYFYAFDLEKYDSERSFYFDYEKYVPGPVARDFQTLMNLMATRMAENFTKKRRDFSDFNFGDADGGAAVRVMNEIVK